MIFRLLGLCRDARRGFSIVMTFERLLLHDRTGRPLHSGLLDSVVVVLVFFCRVQGLPKQNFGRILLARVGRTVLDVTPLRHCYHLNSVALTAVLSLYARLGLLLGPICAKHRLLAFASISFFRLLLFVVHVAFFKRLSLRPVLLPLRVARRLLLARVFLSHFNLRLLQIALFLMLGLLRTDPVVSTSRLSVRRFLLLLLPALARPDLHRQLVLPFHALGSPVLIYGLLLVKVLLRAGLALRIRHQILYALYLDVVESSLSLRSALLSSGGVNIRELHNHALMSGRITTAAAIASAGLLAACLLFSFRRAVMFLFFI